MEIDEQVKFSLKRMLIHGGKQGVIGGLILSAFTVLIYTFNVNTFSVVMGLITFLITWGTMIIFGYRSAAAYRSETDLPRIPYWVGLVSIFGAVLTMIYISAIFSLILHTVIDPGYAAELIREYQEMIYNNSRIPDTMKQELIMQAELSFEPVKQFTSSLTGGILISLLIAAIMAFFVRKNPKYKEII